MRCFLQPRVRNNMKGSKQVIQCACIVMQDATTVDTNPAHCIVLYHLLFIFCNGFISMETISTSKENILCYYFKLKCAQIPNRRDFYILSVTEITDQQVETTVDRDEQMPRSVLFVLYLYVSNNPLAYIKHFYKITIYCLSVQMDDLRLPRSRVQRTRFRVRFSAGTGETLVSGSGVFGHVL